MTLARSSLPLAIVARGRHRVASSRLTIVRLGSSLSMILFANSPLSLFFLLLLFFFFFAYHRIIILENQPRVYYTIMEDFWTFGSVRKTTTKHYQDRMQAKRSRRNASNFTRHSYHVDL